MQAELRDALNALGGMHADGLLEHYLFYTAAHIKSLVTAPKVHSIHELKTAQFLVRFGVV
jgi:hypothetical protein